MHQLLVQDGVKLINNNKIINVYRLLYAKTKYKVFEF